MRIGQKVKLETKKAIKTPVAGVFITFIAIPLIANRV
jgi:hypothetical protein